MTSIRVEKAATIVEKEAMPDSLFIKIGGQENFDKVFDSITGYFNEGKFEKDSLIPKVKKIMDYQD